MKHLSEAEIKSLATSLDNKETFSEWYNKLPIPNLNKCHGYEVLSDNSKQKLDLLIERYLLSLIKR